MNKRNYELIYVSRKKCREEKVLRLKLSFNLPEKERKNATKKTT